MQWDGSPTTLISGQTITDEMSTMTFEDLMSFVGADYAVAA